MKEHKTQSDKQSIANYFTSLKPDQRAELERVRKIIQSTAPETEEVITYGMPGFKYKGKYLISFAAFKHHMSIFPGSAAAEALKLKLTDYKTSKGTIQFTVDKPLPEQIIKEIVKLGITRISSS